MIEKFKMPVDLSNLDKPTMDALDGNFDAIEAHVNTVIHSELEGLHRLIDELRAEVARLKFPGT